MCVSKARLFGELTIEGCSCETLCPCCVGESFGFESSPMFIGSTEDSLEMEGLGLSFDARAGVSIGALGVPRTLCPCVEISLKLSGLDSGLPVS